LAGALTFATVPQLSAQEQQLFGQADQVTLDLEAVERSDSAGVALLVSWKRLARQQNKTIVFSNTPEQMRVIARVSGVDQLLSL
jgi:phospholipid transport system transporter-binding protein